MAKYSVRYIYSDGTDGYDPDEYETIEEATAAGEYGCSCNHQGIDTMHMSNPGDYPLDDDDIEFEVITIEE